MQVERINATIRYSQEIQGAWKSLELGAEASLEPDENWTIAQQGLYSLLTGQLKALWGNKNGHSPEHAQNGAENHVEGSWEEVTSYPSPAAEKPAPREHWCPAHQREFKRYEKDGRSWYSHRDGDGWCKERMKEVVASL
jgi:hypothetical protein